jgi:cyclin-dependent kinase 7
MAVSPLIVPDSGERGSTTTKSKLSAASSGNGTPNPAQSGSAMKDVAEQMNEDEKNNYVKGQ